MGANSLRRVLVVRNDRLGDWVLTLPLISAIRMSAPAAAIDAMAKAVVAPLLTGYGGVGKVILSPSDRGRAGFRSAAAEIRKGRYDAAVVVHPDLVDTAAVWWAGVRRRVGNGYRGYSPLYNRPVFFHRAPSTSHEVEYNLRYVEGLGFPAAPLLDPRITPTDEDRRRARKILSAVGGDAADYVVVHPGSGGSSLNWSPQRYRALAAEITRGTGFAVVVTGGAAERDLARFVAGEGAGRFAIAGETDLGSLLGILSGARFFVSGNTGPMHLAAAVGTPTLAFFSPLRSGSPTRWGPRGNKSRVLTPPGLACGRCPREECGRYNCMEAITLEDALAAARRLLSGQDE